MVNRFLDNFTILKAIACMLHGWELITRNNLSVFQMICTYICVFDILFVVLTNLRIIECSYNTATRFCFFECYWLSVHEVKFEAVKFTSMQNRKQKENSYAKPNLTFQERGTEGSYVFPPHITLAWMDKNKGVIWTKTFLFNRFRRFNTFTGIKVRLAQTVKQTTSALKHVIQN